MGTEAASGASLKVAYIAHDATRSGAPIMLLRIMRWLHANTSLSQRVVARCGGPLLESFRELGSVVEAPDHLSPRSRLIRVAPSRLGLDRFRLPGAAEAFRDADVVYANSSQSAELFDLIPADVPVIAHIHEMAEALRRLPDATAKRLGKRPVHFLVPSAASARGVIASLGVPPDRVSVAHPFIESVRARVLGPERTALRSSIGVGDGTLLIGAAGRFDLCKGVDLIPAICRRVAEGADARFVWIGGGGDDYLFRMVQRDAQLMGVADRITFVGEVADPHDWFNACDVFCLPSREDSFPMVAVENASIGNPVVCFQGSGGVTEYIDDDSGAAVAYLDLDAMANALVQMADGGLRAERGDVAARRAAAFQADVVCPAILATVRRAADR